MNVIELQRALRQLRCSGMAGGLEANFDLIAGPAYANRLKPSLANRGDTGFEQGQGSCQQPIGEARNGRGHSQHHSA